ncbi:MAG: hypothetical protein EOO41_05605, partial [Methanobacteriota archaeon]
RPPVPDPIVQLAADGSVASILLPASGLVEGFADTALSMVPLWLPPQSEVDLWEERWAESTRSLSQWSLLSTFASEVGDSLLEAEAAAMLSEWPRLKDLLKKPAVVSDASRNPATKLWEAQCAVMSLGEVRAARIAMETTTGLALRAWSLLPTYAVSAQEKLLVTAQRVVEVQEAAAVLPLIRDAATKSQQDLPDLRGILSTWRERQPNRWDGMAVWDSLYLWRQALFSHITQALRPRVSEDRLSAMHDTHWSMVRCAHEARKLGLRDVCNTILTRLRNVPAMDVLDLFAKFREQLLANLPDKFTTAYAWMQTRRALNAREVEATRGVDVNTLSPVGIMHTSAAVGAA